MKYCIYCGASMDDDSRFCSNCGADTAKPDSHSESDIAEEKEFLDKTDNILRIERLLWKIEAIILLVISCIYSLIGVLMLQIEPIAIVFIVLCLAVFAPLTAISFKSMSRIDWYRKRIYDDPSSVLDRTGSIGIIVYAALLSGYAVIPVIINFVRTKNCKDVTERIRNRQRGLL